MNAPEHQPDARRRAALRALDVASPLVALAVAAGVVVRLATPWGRAHPRLFAGLDAALLLYFAAEVAARLALAERRLAHVRRRWYDLLVVVPLLAWPLGMGAAATWFLVRQAAMVAARLWRTRAAARLVSQLWLHPARMLVITFALAILMGAALLLTPWASKGEPLGPVDAVFTATSAVCVTGLVVVHTGQHFTRFGQCVILVLIQLGALGLMTFSVSVALVLGRGLSKSHAFVMQNVLDQDSIAEVLALIRFIAVATFAVEAVGAVALFACIAGHEGLTLATLPARLFEAVFHSISAFCNAGFSIFTDSLVPYRDSAWTNLVFCALIILGGLGFPVLRDLLFLGTRRRLDAGRPPGLRTQTKVVLATSAALIVVGAVVFYLVEARNPSTLADPRAGPALLPCLFQSVTARTAGFNTVNIARVGHAGLLLLMLLMYIGASPGSTGGGVKTTTIAVVWATARSALRGRRRAELFRRTLPPDVVRRALALVALSVLLLATAGIALMAVETQPFEDLAFEAVSAFGTVGLSAGATARLTQAGRLIITVLMFVGRLGPLTLALSLVGEVRPGAYAYPEERLMIG